MEEEENEKKEGVFKACLQLSLARIYFVKVWLFYEIQFEIYFLECFMFIRVKYVLQFSRRDDVQNNGFDPTIENRRIVWTFIFDAGEARRKEAFHTITDFTLWHVLSRNSK